MPTSCQRRIVKWRTQNIFGNTHKKRITLTLLFHIGRKHFSLSYFFVNDMAVEACQKFNRSILSHEYITYSSQKSVLARIFTSEDAAECPCISRFRTRYTYIYAAFFHPDLQMQSDAKTHLVLRLKHIVITAFHWKISLRIFTLTSLKKTLFGTFT